MRYASVRQYAVVLAEKVNVHLVQLMRLEQLGNAAVSVLQSYHDERQQYDAAHCVMIHELLWLNRFVQADTN